MAGQRSAHVIGAGLIGTSVGIGLTDAGWKVTVEDHDDAAAQLAVKIGAAESLNPQQPDVVLIAVPPAYVPDMVVSALGRFPEAVVTDVASVKVPIQAAAHSTMHGARFVGSHPMAGRALSGGAAAQGDLFKARPWVVCANGASPDAVNAVVAMAEALHSDVVYMDAVDHDAAVARVSHAPQMVASAVAAALSDLDDDHVALAGQGLRDVTRIAASETGMWSDIASLNSEGLRGAIAHIISDLELVRDADDISSAVSRLIDRGRAQVARIPGKHGGAQRDYASVVVVVPDTPGELARLLTDAGAAGVNVEDLALEHSPRQKSGLTTLFVVPSAVDALTASLSERGWTVI